MHNNVIRPSAPTIEDGIVLEFGEDSYTPFPLAPTPDERRVTAGAMRLAANVMLLLTMQGCKALGPANASHVHRLQHHLARARQRGERIAESERELRLAPQLYGLAQDITLYRTDRSGSASEGEASEHRRPHWRRGHFKTHAFGARHNERKLIFIPPLMVNAHLLGADDGPFPVSYRIR